MHPKAVSILRLFARHGRAMNFKETASLLKTSRGVVSWRIQELERAGFIDRSGQRSYADAALDVPRIELFLFLYDLAERRGMIKPRQPRSAPIGIGPDGRTRFPGRVKTPDVGSTVLVHGRNNVKLGERVENGRHAGRTIFSLTLEEGQNATCPPCDLADVCYGGNMHLAKRWRHGPQLESALRKELQQLQNSRTPKLIRLHVLGDFYSVGYARLWVNSPVPSYGYTHRRPDSAIGRVLAAAPWEHMSIRFSWRHGRSKGVRRRGAVTVTDWSEAKTHDAIPCPVQTDDTATCATCGLCWNTERNIAFKQH